MHNNNNKKIMQFKKKNTQTSSIEITIYRLPLHFKLLALKIAQK